MPHVFDAHNLERLLTDAGPLVGHARRHEQGLSDLVTFIEASGGTLMDGTPSAALPAEGPPASERTNSTDLLRRLRATCVAARSQREIAERILIGLLGDVEAESRRRLRVLVVDDAQDSRELAAMVLEDSGFHTTMASNGLEGLLAAHCLRPAVALMDLNMPVLDGIEAARLLSASPATRDVRLIAYTARADFYEGPMTRLFAGVLRKPSIPEAIVSKVRHVVQS